MSAAESAGLGILGTPKAIKATAGNVGKLAKAPAMLKRTLEKAEKVRKGFEEVAERMETDDSTKEEVKRVGQAAHEAQCFKPEELVTRFWPDQSRVLPAPPKR